jgi:hypothetical protein
MTTVAELLKRYPYVPGSHPRDYRRGDIAMIQGVPDESYREALASIYLRQNPRWTEEETRVRARELARLHQPQSREHIDPERDWRLR